MKNSMASMRTWISILCFTLAAALLAFSFTDAIAWVILPALAAAMILWLNFQRLGWRWLPPVLLLIFVAAAAVGAILAKNPALLIAAAAASLAGWELAEQVPYRQRPGASAIISLSSAAWSRLAAAAILALIIAEVGLYLRMSLPFWGVFLAALLIFFSLYRFYQIFTRG